jgi:hypothetical protein
MGFWSETFGGGNSFKESVANATTRDDDYEYRGGTLYGKDNKAVDPDQFGSDSKYGPLGRADSKSTDAYSYNLNQGNAGTTPLGSNATSERGGLSNGLGAIMRNPVAMGGLGLISGGIGPALMSGAIAAGRGRKYDQKNPAYVNKGKGDPEFRKKAAAQEFSRNFGRLGKEGRSFTKDQLTQIREDPKARIEGAFFKDGDTSKQFKMNMFGNTYEINPETGNSKLIEDQAAAAGGDNDGIAAIRRAVGTQATAPTSTLPAISTESEFAKQQVLSPPAEWLIANGYSDTNPSYEAITKYNTDKRAGVLTMSEGGRLGQTQMQMSQIARKGAINPQIPVGGLQQYGTYLDNRYGDPEFDQKRMQFLREVGQQEQQTFGGGGGSFPSSGLGGKGGAGSPADRLTQPLNELTTATNNTQLIDPVEQYVQSANASSAASSQAPTNSLYKGLSPVFGGAMGGARAELPSSDSYHALYQSALGMAEGGNVQFALGGNEKDLINAMEDVIRRDLADDAQVNPEQMSDQDKIVVAQYVQQYGESALMEMVNSVKNGTADETRERFARGENGMVRGNGDGSGTDDKVTAQLKDGDATQDVLLADGEFVLRKDATQAIEKKYGGGALDKINNAGPDAAKELRRLMPT